MAGPLVAAGGHPAIGRDRHAASWPSVLPNTRLPSKCCVHLRNRKAVSEVRCEMRQFAHNRLNGSAADIDTTRGGSHKGDRSFDQAPSSQRHSTHTSTGQQGKDFISFMGKIWLWEALHIFFGALWCLVRSGGPGPCSRPWTTKTQTSSPPPPTPNATTWGSAALAAARPRAQDCARAQDSDTPGPRGSVKTPIYRAPLYRINRSDRGLHT
jgi:hypothetical protein